MKETEIINIGEKRKYRHLNNDERLVMRGQ